MEGDLEVLDDWIDLDWLRRLSWVVMLPMLVSEITERWPQESFAPVQQLLSSSLVLHLRYSLDDSDDVLVLHCFDVFDEFDLTVFLCSPRLERHSALPLMPGMKMKNADFSLPWLLKPVLKGEHVTSLSSTVSFRCDERRYGDRIPTADEVTFSIRSDLDILAFSGVLDLLLSDIEGADSMLSCCCVAADFVLLLCLPVIPLDEFVFTESKCRGEVHLIDNGELMTSPSCRSLIWDIVKDWWRCTLSVWLIDFSHWHWLLGVKLRDSPL